jgi:EmrB/QacA subfamily drug resistance transporter
MVLEHAMRVGFRCFDLLEEHVSTPATSVQAAERRRTADQARYPGHPVITLAVIVCCQFMVGLDATVINIALPKIHTALHFSAPGLAWVTSAYTLSFGGLLLLGGRVGDIVGRRRTFMAGLAVFAVASLFGGLATSSGWLIAARIAQGCGAAFAAPSALALITTNFEEGPKRNRALAAVAGSYAASLALGLIAGGVITEWVSWRWVLFINVPIAVLVAVLAPLFIQEAERHTARFDLPGALISTAGVSALVYGFIHAASDGWRDTVTLVSFIAAVILITAYVAVELRTEQPITPFRLFRNRNRAAAYLNIMILSSPMAGMFFFVTQLLQDLLHYKPLGAGLAFLPMAATLMVGGGIAAQLLPRTGHRPLIFAGTFLIAIGMVWIAWDLPHTISYAGGVLGPTMLFGGGAGVAFTAINEMILSGVEPRDAGAASSLLEATQWIGTALGLSILVTVFGTAGRHAVENHPAGLNATEVGRYVTTHGMSVGFVAGAILVGCAFLVTVFAMRGVRPASKADGEELALPAAVPADAGAGL